MKQSIRTLPLFYAASACLLIGVATIVLRGRAQSPTVSAPAVTVLPTSRSEMEVRDLDIAFYEARAAQDPASALDRGVLAALLYARARYSGSTADLDRAEQLTRTSLALRAERNGQSFELLASVLMARHAFREARTVMHRADSLTPRTPSHLALLGEIELELGDYNAAAAHFSTIRFDGEQFTIGARLARWYEITGRTPIARQFLQRAITRVTRRDDLPQEQVAWFHYRLGELELRVGNFVSADSAFQRSLLINPDDIRALGGLTRLAVKRAQWHDAIGYGTRATAIQLDPSTVGAVSVAYAALGDTLQARSFAQAMAVSALQQPSAIHRGWGLFLLDHGSEADRSLVLERARTELNERRDVYGHDLVAWALYRHGAIEEARAEMALALSQGTEDDQLTEHARALGVEHRFRKIGNSNVER